MSGDRLPVTSEVLGDLIFRDRVARSRTEKAIDWAVVIAQLSELLSARLGPWGQPPVLPLSIGLGVIVNH